ncbi:hypothetical protein SDC9_119642 [bioreactor metagenome]|uniref:Lysozyme n=1 Tax=bioreactor metagenome TaxID=1076179 RepID=A0A645C4E7_9ZZZZ
MINQDDYFPQNASEATANGLDIGVYFFSQATTVDEAVEEAEFVLKTIEDYDITYPIIFDMEDISGADTRIDSLSSADVTAITIAFCEKIAVAGYTPMIYGNSHWFFAKLELDQVLEYDKWYAQYSTWPYYPYEFSIWQYSNTGTVAGIEGNVDRNISFVDYGAH